MRAAVRARVGSCGLWLCLTLAASTVHRVSAQQSADQVVLDLNHSAMEAYNNMDINQAGSKLEEALRVAAQGGVVGPLLAQTNMNLAIIYIGGLGDNDRGRDLRGSECAARSADQHP
jgi:hypothetical protein